MLCVVLRVTECDITSPGVGNISGNSNIPSTGCPTVVLLELNTCGTQMGSCSTTNRSCITQCMVTEDPDTRLILLRFMKSIYSLVAYSTESQCNTLCVNARYTLTYIENC